MIVVFECTGKLCSSHRAISGAIACYIIAAAKKLRSGGKFKPWAKQSFAFEGIEESCFVSWSGQSFTTLSSVRIKELLHTPCARRIADCYSYLVLLSCLLRRLFGSLIVLCRFFNAFVYTLFASNWCVSAHRSRSTAFAPFTDIVTKSELNTMCSFIDTDYAAGQPSIMENMTFGIEFEFLCYTPRDVSPKSHLSKVLKEPVVLPCTRCTQSHTWTLPVKATLDGFVPAFSTWTMHRDNTVKASDDEEVHVPEGSNFYSMELVSRVMNFSKPTPDPMGQRYPCTGGLLEWDSETEISTFIQKVHEAFSGTGYCASTNKSTGLHIHFGNGNPRTMAFEGPTPGICGSVPEYKYGQVSEWVGAGSRAFLEMMRWNVKRALKGDPEINRFTITKELQTCIPPFWLDTILEFDEEVEDFLNTWPRHDSTGELLSRRSMAVNLQNLTSNIGKSTVEVRAAPGSLEFSEVWAWSQFMGKLMLWLSTPDIDHNAIITKIWADPASTVVDLLKEIGAPQTTINYYTDRLSVDWAVRRHTYLASTIKTDDPFKPFLLTVEDNRLADYRREAVDCKILQKLQGGYYGQIPDAVSKTLPASIQDCTDVFLNMDTCDYEKWSDKVISDEIEGYFSVDYLDYKAKQALRPI
ncbi:hypothetical protein KCU71_g189, partial [Aureobasidium melanogenum]